MLAKSRKEYDKMKKKKKYKEKGEQAKQWKRRNFLEGYDQGLVLKQKYA